MSVREREALQAQLAPRKLDTGRGQRGHLVGGELGAVESGGELVRRKRRARVGQSVR